MTIDHYLMGIPMCYQLNYSYGTNIIRFFDESGNMESEVIADPESYRLDSDLHRKVLSHHPLQKLERLRIVDGKDEQASILVAKALFTNWTHHPNLTRQIVGRQQRELLYNNISTAIYQIPGMSRVVKMPTTGQLSVLSSAIIQLNDQSKWTKEQIADWLETLDNIPTFGG